MTVKIELVFPIGKSAHITYVDELISAETCNQLISACKEYYDVLFELGPTMGGINALVKKTHDFRFNASDIYQYNVPPGQFIKISEEIQEALNSAVSLYVQSYERLWEVPSMKDTGFRLQHYVKNSGFYRTHHDGDCWNQDTDVNKRILGVIIYLNDIAVGGDTFFPEHNYGVTPKAGRISLFPAAWTHPHGSRVSVSEDKWIISTFIMYNPTLITSVQIEDILIEPEVLSELVVNDILHGTPSYKTHNKPLGEKHD